MPVDRFSLALGLEVAGAATALAAVLGISLAWILQNREFPGKRSVSAAATAAVALPAPLLCYYLLAVWGHFWRLSAAGLVAAGVLATLPLLLRSARSSFAAITPSYGKAARSLGGAEWRVLAQIELPLAMRPILSAVALALARVLLELAAAFWIADARL